MYAQTPAASRLTHLLDQTGRTALGVFLPAGFPSRTAGIDLLHSFAEQGADILEVGVPHTAPVFDGPVIKAAYETALAQGTVMAHVLSTVRHAVTGGAPVVAMTYWAPVLAYGIERFADDLAVAGAAGVMIPDLPPHEAGRWRAAARKAGIHTPQFAPRDAGDEDLTRIAAAASGWIYAPAAVAATGYQGDLDLAAIQHFTGRLRHRTEQPIVAGIGISTPARARQVAPYADGVVIGTPVVRPLLEQAAARGAAQAMGHVRAFADALRAATAVPPHRTRACA
ncbi:tryptophan synthase subunit alpha [Streptomyces yaizuensis]|uniref:tryptophan synthase subunit alpha n=1 Tax=Streptomyces yaizuensis TaxID=2989713 RepID=UPI002B1F0ECE|nr:tryptophan synthase subunit alpha [Streptomyces sp. YSPA8]